MNRSDLHKLERGDNVVVRLWMNKRLDGRSRDRVRPNKRAEFFGQVVAKSEHGRVLVQSYRGADWWHCQILKPVSGRA